MHVKRADEDPRPGLIDAQMIKDLLVADLVIADLSGVNPNAFYEIGIRHMWAGRKFQSCARRCKKFLRSSDRGSPVRDTSSPWAAEVRAFSCEKAKHSQRLMHRRNSSSKFCSHLAVSRRFAKRHQTRRHSAVATFISDASRCLHAR